MTLNTMQKNLVPLSHTLGMGQWDKTQNCRTTYGTSAGQISLKALANKVLQRSKVWDKRGRKPEKDWDKTLQNTLALSQEKTQHERPHPLATPPRFFQTCPQYFQGCFTCPHGNILAQHFCKLDTGFDHSLLEERNIKTCHCGWNTQ